ncbi:Retrovirus-related Pol polyprotein from transposon RE1 [Sesamum angolense]|uniref:Retrovirus-related Pol polyprotein from transposon RE1 n=1 Tax=Sesamum angolense TaxID=2727404 RepID=A0AAE1WJE2_9LAMI|nr:Retrovirus-related Pol polyprotein from transposon RE1 [Sesamum angolense]
MAGMVTCGSSSWIVDTGAKSHMCGDARLFDSFTPLPSSGINIHLPNNTIDLRTKETLILGRQIGRLYFIDQNSFVSTSLPLLTDCDIAYYASDIQMAFRCVFLGYAPNHKGYKLYDLDNNEVIIFRDVIFHEHSFPYHSIHSTLESASIPIPNPIPDPVTVLPMIPGPELPKMPQVLVPSSSDNPDNATTNVLPCRSQKATKPPVWLAYFQCNTSSDYTIEPSDLAPLHIEFLAALSTVCERRCYVQAKGCLEWEQIMNEEIAALEQNQTWEVVDLPPGKRAIGSKWVYKVKLRPDGSIDRYKARLVAKGYNQVEGVDYIDCFSPVAKAVTVWVLLAVASSHALPIHQVDINNAFLHAFLDEDIYISAPDGFPFQSGKVCKLKRSLYGVKQASRQWNHEFTTNLLGYGFSQSPHDHCFFTKDTNDGLLILLVYVDDVLITGPSQSQIDQVKDLFHSAFTIKDLGLAKYFLCLEIARSTNGTSVTQQKYIRNIISDIGFQSSKPVVTPLPLGLKLTSHNITLLPDPEPYRRLVGRLLYLSFTRPDISFGAQQLSQFVHNPGQVHMDAALHLWISYLLRDLRIDVPTPIPIFCDNQAAIHIVANPVFHERTKHLEIDCHLVRDKFKAGFVLPSFVSSRWVSTKVVDKGKIFGVVRTDKCVVGVRVALCCGGAIDAAAAVVGANSGIETTNS